MGSLSEKLRRERELRGISLKQISEDTKIGVRFLEALEEDRLELIPGEFYRRSYLRAYARYLGLDEDRALNAYSYSRNDGRAEDEDVEEREEAWPFGRLAVGLLVVTVAAGFLLLRSRTSGTEDLPPSSAAPSVTSAEARVDTPPSVEAPPPVDVSPSVEVPASDLAPSTPSTPSLDVSDPSAPLRLVVAVNEPCWLEIEADGVVVATGLKEEGFRQSLAAQNEVRLWLGNAGGVALWVNERRAKPLGADGQVRKGVTITPANFGDFVVGEEDVS